MSKITITTVGNGIAWVNDYDPNYLDYVTLTVQPDAGESLVDIQAWDENGYSIALYVQPTQTFLWQYGTMDILVTFTGTPPTPTSRKKKRMPIWMYPALRG